MCDPAISTCYSDDTGTGAMLVLNLTGGTLAPSDFILNGAGDQRLDAPVVTTASSTPAPEPTTSLLLGIGVVGAFGLHRRRSTLQP